MDAKFFSVRSFNFSGIQLFWLLGAGLIGGGGILDIIGGRFPLSATSITMPLLVAAIAAAALGFWVVPLLQVLKTGQIVREDGPQTHLKKSGTPTMGGVFFVPVAVAIAVVWSGLATDVMAASALTLAYAGIGWLDDWQILRRKSNKGISPKMKLALQIGFAALFCLWLFFQSGISTTIALPFGWMLPLGLLFWPLAVFALVAESNSTNLIDGVDGLAGGTCAIALLGLAVLVAPTSSELMIFCAALSGGCLGFVAHNRNPARVFMGDTGSLALGGALTAVALLTNTLWGLLIISGLFFVEALSVMAQVGYYKATKGPDGVGKRLFKMAPIHHHLELSGWTETKIVGVFYAIAGILILVSFVLH